MTVPSFDTEIRERRWGSGERGVSLCAGLSSCLVTTRARSRFWNNGEDDGNEDDYSCGEETQGIRGEACPGSCYTGLVVRMRTAMSADAEEMEETAELENGKDTCRSARDALLLFTV